MRYRSTRGEAGTVSAGQAIIYGLAGDGGLYVPETIPSIHNRLEELLALPYPGLALEILKLYLTDYPEVELKACVDKAYCHPGNFGHPSFAPLVPLRENDNVYFLELFHGKTLAFKDMALSLLPHLLSAAARRERPGETTVLLTATSGDTGKAALEGFKDVDGVLAVVFYPQEGVSHAQKLQMLTQEGNNTFVIGVRGNFDDAQTGVKKIFNDITLKKEWQCKHFSFSSANSINIGRLLPQIVYYVYAYAQLARQNKIKAGDAVDFTVPTGNFGNILAGYYARQMGLPIRRLICASNQNNVLYDFIRTGVYDAKRSFVSTISPSMDILISSNLERLLFHICGDSTEVARLMAELNRDGRFRFNHPLPSFRAYFASEAETRATLRETARLGYVTDPHTAVAYHAYQKYTAEDTKTKPNETDGVGKSRDDARAVPNVIIATASPFKFSGDVWAALTENEKDITNNTGVFQQMENLSALTGLPVPIALSGLRHKPIRHKMECDPVNMPEVLNKIMIKN